MRFKNLDLSGAILIVAINVGWAQIPNRPLVIAIIFGLPLVLVLPGYTLTQALFCKRTPDPSSNLILQPRLKIGQPISAIDHIILSLGLSLAIDVLVGFMLNLLPIGLEGLSWIISLGLITTIFALLAVFRRRKNRVKSVRLPEPHITINQSILFGLAILVATAAVWLSLIRLPATQADFTQFWMLPSTHANNSCAVLIGVQSNESTPVTYRIVVKINGTQVNSWSSVALAPQEKWEQSVSIKPETATSLYIEAQLYRVDKPDSAYRDVHLTMHSVRESRNGQEQQCTT